MSERQTEDSILNSIPDFRGDDNGQASTVPGQEGEGQGQASTEPTQQPAAPDDGQGGKGSGDDQPETGIIRRHDGLKEVASKDTPNARDLVDPVTGRVVARGGIERHVYETGARHARENNQLKQRLEVAERTAKASNETMAEATRLNVSPADQVVAIRVMSDFLRDPVKTLELLVEEVRSKGYQIPFLSQGVNPGMDMAAISRMIDGKLQPLTQQQQHAREQTQQRSQAETMLNGFLEQNPEAQVNLDVIAEMLDARPSLSIENAYLQMFRWAVDNQLDPRQSIRAQLDRPQQPPRQPTPASTRPLPNGRSAQGGAEPVADSGQYSENSSWGDIIRQTMQESGLQLR